MICFQNQQDINIFQWVKRQLLPHNQESIKDVWEPAGYLYSHMDIWKQLKQNKEKAVAFLIH